MEATTDPHGAALFRDLLLNGSKDLPTREERERDLLVTSKSILQIN